MKKLLAIIMAICFAMTLSTWAEEGEAKVKAPAAPTEGTQISGKITKRENVLKDKNGTEIKVVKYLVTTSDGSEIMLPAADSKAMQALNLESFVDKNVTLTVSATSRTYKDLNGAEKKQTLIRKISKIEAVAAAAPATE